MVLLGLAVLAAAAAPAAAQNRRRQLTELIKETRLRVEKAATDPERHDLADQLEAYRHEIGYKDDDGGRIVWDVSYQKSLTEALDTEISTAGGIAKGAWGLLPLSDDTRRAWRVVARRLLQRSDTEEDSNQRNRFGFAGMLLVHNADVLDALLGELPKIQEARKAVPDGDEHADRRRAFDQALGAAGNLINLARGVADGKRNVGDGEIRGLGDGLSRIQQAVAQLNNRSGPKPADAAKDDNETHLKRVADLETRIRKLQGPQPEMAGKLRFYLEQVRFGLDHPPARGPALTLLDHAGKAVEYYESITTSPVASSEYKARKTAELADAVKRIHDRPARGGAYGTIRNLVSGDQVRRQLEAWPVANPVRAALWQGREWADRVLGAPPDDAQRNLAEKYRNVLGQLAWQGERLYAAPPPADRHLAAVYRAGLRELEKRLAKAAELVPKHQGEAEGACWQAVGVIGDVDHVRRTDEELARLGRYVSVPDSVRKSIGLVAAGLFDDKNGNKGRTRNRLRDLRDACSLLREFHQTALDREDLPEASRLSRGRYYPMFRTQSERGSAVLKGLVDGKPEERDDLRRLMPLWRLMASSMILRRAEADGALPRLRAARSVTMDPARVTDAARKAGELLGPIFIELGKTRRDDVARVIQPIVADEAVCRTAAGALRQLQREADAPPRLDLVIWNLRQASHGGHPWEVHGRWNAAWHAGQAGEAGAWQYGRTADYHAGQLGRNNPLHNIPLTAEGGRR